MSGKNGRYGGFLLAEMTVAMTILGTLLVGLALSLHGFAKFNHYQLVRQQCISAAQAELDSIATTGEPIPDENFKQLWPRISISIKKSPGAGQWRGMELVELTTNGRSFRKEVNIRISRYILRGESLAEGK